jgi:nucleoside-diphosphate-sugar epimerase
LILVTGGSGFVGGALLQLLLLNGIEVRASARRSLFAEFNGLQHHLIHDMTASTEWSAALNKVQTVVHCAARVHVMADTFADPLTEFRRVNVGGTLNLARQAAVAGVRRFVFVSSVKVNGEATLPGQAFTETDTPAPQDSYGQSKYEAELGLQHLAAGTGMEVVIIRPPLVYGPRVKANFASLMRAVKRGWPLPLGAVQNQRSLVALDNLVDLIVTCLHHPAAANQTFLASDGQDLSTPDLVRGIARAAGVTARLWPVPVLALKATAGALGKGAAVQRLCGSLQVDISKARSLLGWVPPVTVDEGLRRAMGMGVLLPHLRR